MSSSHRLYCKYRPGIAVAEALEYVPASVCATCEAYSDVFKASHHAIVVYIDGFSDTVPVSALEARLEDVSPM